MPLPFLAILLINLGAAAASQLLAPKPRLRSPKETALSELQIATATEDRAIPYIAGMVKQRAANFTWYGDFEARPITKWIRTSIFGTGVRQRIGFRYNLGWEAAIGYGPLTLHKINYDDKEIWNIGEGAATPAHIQILKENLFGGEESEGGINWELQFYEGNQTQGVDPYMLTQVNPYSGHRRICKIVSQGPSYGAIFSTDPIIIRFLGHDVTLNGAYYVSGRGYIGTQAQLRPIDFYVSSYPQNINAAKARIGDDANPAEVIYQLFTDKFYGAGRSPSRLDSAALNAVEDALYDEGLGISVLWEQTGGVDELIRQILETVDGVIYEDFETGLIKIKLIRNDYAAEDIKTISKRDVLNVRSFATTTWATTTNQLHYSFTSRGDDYASVSDMVPDLGGFRNKGLSEPAAQTYPLIYEKALAQKIALRELRELALPLSKATLEVNRSGAFIYPGDVVRWDDERYGNDKIFRVVKVDYGRLQSGACTLFLVEDVFSFGKGIYVENGGGGWTPVSTTALNAPAVVILEQPYFIHANNDNKLWTLAQKPNPVHLDYDIQARANGAAYALVGISEDFTPVGTLYADFPQLTTEDQNEDGFELVNVRDLDKLSIVAADEILQGDGLLYFESTGEFMQYQGAEYNSETGRATIKYIHREVLDTPPLAHEAGERVWAVAEGAGMPEFPYANGATVDVKIQPRTNGDLLTLNAATANSITIAQRALRPLPPCYLTVNGEYVEEMFETGDLLLEWLERNRLTQTTVLSNADATVTPEAGVTYEVEIYGLTGVLLRTETGLTDPEYTYTNANELIDNGTASLELMLTFKVYSVRDGLRSKYPFVRRVLRVDESELLELDGALVAGPDFVIAGPDVVIEG